MSKQQYFDVAVIGSGPGGYVAAIKASSLGKKVALIEKDQWGGTCLNYGCIPTKTLIASADAYDQLKKLQDYGITIEKVTFDYKLMKQRKDRVIGSIRQSLEGLLKNHGVTLIKGSAEFLSQRALKINCEDSFFLEASKIIIASGSTTLDIPSLPCDHQHILNSTSILEMDTLPTSLVIIGGGYIGCEFASLYASLGVKITIVEAMPSILAAQGKTLSSFMTKIFKNKGIEIITNTSVKNMHVENGQVKVHLTNDLAITAQKALVSIGRKVVTEGLHVEKAGIVLTDRKVIPVNGKMETEVPGIYAIGDVTGKAMLAHVASHQGMIAAQNALGHEAFMHYHAVPAVIFTSPEIATVGLTEEEALEKKLPYQIGTFPFAALGKAQASLHTEGFAQIMINTQTREILGACIVGHDASSMIGQMALAIQNELTVDCLIDTIHAHPTMTEAWLEAALLAIDSPIHFPPKRAARG
jgi:dihydrolipoamide dehydrogenase